MAANEFYMLTLHQRYTVTGEPMQNNYFYRQTAGSSGAEDLLTDFRLNFLPKVNRIQHPAIANDRIRVINLQVLTDFWEDLVPGAGTNTDGAAQMLPLHDALNFTLRLNTRAVKPGSKRYSGITEFPNNGGIYVPNSTEIEELRVAHYTVLNDDETNDWEPVVIKRIKYTTEEGNEAYRLPGVGDTIVYGRVVTALTNLRVTTQDTRGNGR